MSKRKLKDWLVAWEEYLSDGPSPSIFRRWSGLCAVAGALERKVWVTSFGERLYPNLYCTLVAPPGVGKSFVINKVQQLWVDLKTHHIASSSVSKASLMDELKEAERHLVMPGHPTYSFNCLNIAADELGVLLPSYEAEFMNTLNKIYDGSHYAERKRGKEINFQIKAPLFNLIAGTQPSYLREFLPEGAWDQGFLSRSVLIYSGDSIKGDLDLGNSKASTVKKKKKELTELVEELKHIGQLFGEFAWTPEAASSMQSWYMEDGPPQPDHPKLTHYNIRRPAHLIKLCQIASIIESDELLITHDHFDRALSWLIEVEHWMPEIFKAMAQGGDAQIIEECWHFAYKIYLKEQKPIKESRIIRFLQDKTPSHNVVRLYDSMVRGELFKQVPVNKLGTCVVPVMFDRE